MLILPLKFVREEDKKTVGINLFHLAKLGHLGLPVVESVVVIPPISEFEKALHIILKPHINIKDHLGNLKSEISKLKIPESLTTFEMVDFDKGNNKYKMNIEKLWENLLEKWTGEIISKIERGEKKIMELTPQLIIFSANFASIGNAYYDEDKGHAVIKTQQGKLDFASSQAIENIVIVGNKKLLLPQVYNWGIEDNKIKILKVTPFTQSLPDSKPNSESKNSEEKPQIVTSKKPIKTATKILLNYNGEIINDFSADGALLNIKNLNTDKVNDEITKVLNFSPNTKLFFNPEFSLSPTNNLEFAKLFLFFKNKKKLDAQIILPETYSVDEYLQLKRDFATIGIYSKGSLKLWKQFNNVADFMNLDSYLDAGFDGAILDLDKIGKLVVGLESDEILRSIKSDWINAIEKFLKEMGLPKIIRNSKSVLIKGNLARNEDLLNYFIKLGVWGIATDNNVVNSIREHISFLEKLAVKKLDV